MHPRFVSLLLAVALALCVQRAEGRSLALDVAATPVPAATSYEFEIKVIASGEEA